MSCHIMMYEITSNNTLAKQANLKTTQKQVIICNTTHNNLTPSLFFKQALKPRGREKDFFFFFF